VADRAAATQTVVDKVSSCLEALQARGIDTSILVITGGGTGSFSLEGNSGVFTELQPGSYVLCSMFFLLFLFVISLSLSLSI
jgi:hypothetical protein